MNRIQIYGGYPALVTEHPAACSVEFVDFPEVRVVSTDRRLAIGLARDALARRIRQLRDLGLPLPAPSEGAVRVPFALD